MGSASDKAVDGGAHPGRMSMVRGVWRRRCSPIDRRGRRRGPAAGQGEGKGEGPPSWGEGAHGVELAVGGDQGGGSNCSDGQGAVSEGDACAVLEKEEKGRGRKGGDNGAAPILNPARWGRCWMPRGEPEGGGGPACCRHPDSAVGMARA
jgi:hypothetical protein